MKEKSKKAIHKCLSLLLAAVMLLTVPGFPALAETTGQETRAQGASPANPVHHCTTQNDGTDTTGWSYVYFGSYPQTEVTGDALTAAITGASYNSNGDAWVGGIKYRRISKDDTNYSGNFGDSDYRYFKWERIKWRVLQNDGSTLFVVADKGLDCKDYHETVASITWEDCTIRKWLNSDFYSTAFSTAEQEAIVEQDVVNDNNPYYGTESGNDTKDYIFLLSIREAINPEYGFCQWYTRYSASRRVQASDYAQAMGADTDTSGSYAGNCTWVLRSPGSYTNFAAYVNARGDVIQAGHYVSYYPHTNGISACVPALHITLSSDLWSLADDGSSGAGGNGGTGNVATTSGNDITIQVNDIGDGSKLAVPLENAAVHVEYFGNASTDAAGKAVIENNLTDQPLINSRISITKEGYREYYFYKDIYNKNAELLWDHNSVSVMMRKLQEKDRENPYVSTLMCRTSAGLVYDAMTSQKKYRVLGSGQALDLQMNAVWNGKTPSSYVLYQENGISYTSADGIFHLDMGEDFEAKYPIYAKLVAADGTTVVEKTQFVIQGSASVSSSGGGLDLVDTDSTGTLGDDVAFLSGQSVSIQLKNVNISVSVSEGKVKAVIGASKSLSEGGEFTNEEWGEWKKLCEHQPKDLNLSQWKNVIESIDTNWTVNVKGSTEVYGYLEGTLNEGGDTVLAGKLKLDTSLSAGIQTQYMVGVIPIYAKISIGVDGGAEGTIGYNWTKKAFDTETTDITLSVEPYLAAEAGVGVMAVATVGIEGKGSLPLSTKLGNSADTTLSLKGGLSLKAKLLCFEYSLKLAEREVRLFPKEDTQSGVEAVGLSELSMNDFELSDNRCMEEESLWLGEGGIQTFSLETTETGSVERVLKTNMNPDAEMQMVNAGGTKMILWTESDPQRGAVNSSKLVYSVYHAADDTWSAPEAVADDGTADYAPSVVSDGERIYVAWQNIAKEFEDTADLSKIAAASTIAMAEWTEESGFSDAATISKPNVMAVSPKIGLNGEGSPYIAYLQNTDDNLLLTTGENNILYSVVNGGSIEHEIFVENAGLVMAMDTAYTDGYEVSYTLDMDNDLSTLEDREIIVCGADSHSTQNGCMDSNARYVKNGNRTLQFWYQDGSIAMMDASGKETLVYQDETGALTDDFHVVSGKENQLAVVWTAVDENGNKQIEGSLYDSGSGEWSKSIRISDTDANVYNPQGIFTEDGKLQFLYKKTDETQTDLCVLTAEPSVNLAIENAYADETSFVPGSMAKISLLVKNNGSKTAEGYTVDAAGTKTTVSERLAPGESAVVEADYMVPSDLSYQTLNIAIEAEGDMDTTDNRFTLAVGYTDLAVSLVKDSYAFGEQIEVYVANESCVDTSATLEIRKNSREGELIKSIDLGTISKGELAAATYLWNEDAQNYSADIDTLYFDVVSQKPEQYTNNNYDFIAIESYTEPGTDAGDTEEGKKPETGSGSGSGSGSGNGSGSGSGSGSGNGSGSGSGSGSSSRISISSAKATLSKTSYTYNGKQRKPGVTVKAGKKQLKKNTDYTVSYKNNTSVGTASVVITGKGNYKDKITKTFKILPKGTSVSGKITPKSKGFTVKWKKQSKSATGYQIQYSTSKKFTKKTTAVKTVKKASTTKLTVKKLKAKKKYYVRIRTYKTVKGKKYYSAWSKSKSVTTKK